MCRWPVVYRQAVLATDTAYWDSAGVTKRQGRPQVTVPMVVGKTVLAGRQTAGAAQVVLAPSNADGPGLGGLLWPHESEYVITSQSPAGARCSASTTAW